MSDEFENQNVEEEEEEEEIESEPKMEKDVTSYLTEDRNYDENVSDIEDFEYVPKYEDWDVGEQC